MIQFDEHIFQLGWFNHHLVTLWPTYCIYFFQKKVRQTAQNQDLKTAFEPQREKLKTFNLKQIVTRNGTVLMNMLERLLESTEIDARDVETEQTLLEQLGKKNEVVGGWYG